MLEAYRTQGARPASPRPKVQLTPKESLIVSCVTQGMKNKEIALRVGTTEQVVKNYLRKVYDKLGVADRLELALFCLHNRVLDGAPKGSVSRSRVFRKRQRSGIVACHRADVRRSLPEKSATATFFLHKRRNNL